jgi:hypothetical protein
MGGPGKDSPTEVPANAKAVRQDPLVGKGHSAREELGTA